MTTLDRISRRLGEYLTLDQNDPQLVRMVNAFVPERERLLEVFPFLALMYATSESEGAEQSATVLEAVLFDIWWVDRFSADRDCVTNCRRKVETILSLLVDKSFNYTHDPSLCVWAVIRVLIIERTARSGVKKLFRSREAEMLDRVISDCQEHVRDRRPLPRDLGMRLRALESQGVILPSDIYAVLEATDR